MTPTIPKLEKIKWNINQKLTGWITSSTGLIINISIIIIYIER